MNLGRSLSSNHVVSAKRAEDRAQQAVVVRSYTNLRECKPARKIRVSPVDDSQRFSVGDDRAEPLTCRVRVVLVKVAFANADSVLMAAPSRSPAWPVWVALMDFSRPSEKSSNVASALLQRLPSV